MSKISSHHTVAVNACIIMYTTSDVEFIGCKILQALENQRVDQKTSIQQTEENYLESMVHARDTGSLEMLCLRS